ncbi:MULTISPECIES: DNA-binding protein [Achromobacter]|uniref:Addiction module antidote protein n=1 Tax=Achromobacter ruhlandii TaxID=72557 RepID=A0A2M9GXZ8_9BURK|nr:MULTISPECIES: addiction module antidote protein [Achromobacter]AMG47204.1 addiction module antidote protein [Achromobacter xylosoxidans]MCM2570686.1 addiction module antidote protein [Achromobacter xylosoxidans]MCV6796264.1 addiction module antidote protein [Achromobacter ruhlandii]MCV6802672.1 addiction module antidote protein [Achromobacter ruhlandii]MCV6811009.1 addiction module antidote protein [Achromobacter ruhlandii]
MKSRLHDEAMAQVYAGDRDLALATLNEILADGSQAELLIVLRQMTQAFGGMQAVAEQARLNPTQLYRTLSPKGNPSLASLLAILKAMGLRLAVMPLANAAAPVRMG